MLGIDTVELTLDLLIAPDLSGHQWKDEDEFAERVAAGMYGADELQRLRAVGRGVLQRAHVVSVRGAPRLPSRALIPRT